MPSEKYIRKMQRQIYNLIADIAITPQDNPARFNLLRRKLEKLSARYVELTGKDDLQEIMNVAHGTPAT